MTKVCQPHAIVSCNLLFTFGSHNLSPGQPQNIAFSIGKLKHLTYWTPTKWCQLDFLVSNMIQNIRQHHFEANKGLIFDYAFSFVA